MNPVNARVISTFVIFTVQKRDMRMISRQPSIVALRLVVRNKVMMVGGGGVSMILLWI